MTLLYDPIKRKPRAWVVILMLMLPILVALLIFFTFKQIADRNKSQAQMSEVSEVSP